MSLALFLELEKLTLLLLLLKLEKMNLMLLLLLGWLMPTWLRTDRYGQQEQEIGGEGRNRRRLGGIFGLWDVLFLRWVRFGLWFQCMNEPFTLLISVL